MAVKDMYADLEKIEARGKRKKEKSKGFFSPFGKKEEPEPDEQKSPEPVETSEPAPPAKESMFSKRKETHPVAPQVKQSKPEPAHIPEPVVDTPPPVKPMVHEPVPIAPAHEPIVQKADEPKPNVASVKPAAPVPMKEEPSTKPTWKPLTGSKLSKAYEDLLSYKKWLNKGYKSRVLTKEQCATMVHAKEIELGLKPPE